MDRHKAYATGYIIMPYRKGVVEMMSNQMKANSAAVRFEMGGARVDTYNVNITKRSYGITIQNVTFFFSEETMVSISEQVKRLSVPEMLQIVIDNPDAIIPPEDLL